MIKNFGVTLLLAMFFLVLIQIPAQAILFDFHCITNNDPNDAAIGEDQLLVDVTSADNGNQVLFTFFNTGPANSSITGIYFDDGSLLGISEVYDNPPATSFARDGKEPKPENLPGGNPIGFDTTEGFYSVDSDPPVQPSGVNPGESLGILFNLETGATFDNVVNNELIDPEVLRIGIHVQGMGSDSNGSESFVNNPTSGGGLLVIPEPTTVALMGLGILGIFGVVIRQRRKVK
jgi:hypothetical protein